MSALQAAELAIYQRLEANQPTNVVVKYPNQPFKPPAPDAANPMWMSLDVLWGDGALQSMGLPGGSADGRNEIVGVIMMSFFGPQGVGAGALLAKVDAVRDAFSRQVFSGVRCGVVGGPTPNRSEGEWLQLTVRVPFSVEELV